MPIIEHSEVPMPAVVDRRRQRTLVSQEQGAVSLTINEVELHPGWEGRLHTHPIDIGCPIPDDGLTVCQTGSGIRVLRNDEDFLGICPRYSLK